MHLGINTLFHVPNDVGGTETYLLEILRAAYEEYPALRITFFTQRDNDILLRKLFDKYPNVRFWKLPFKAKFRAFRIVAEQMLLPRCIAASGVDVLWSPGYTAPFRCRCPQVVTVHDLQYKRYPEDLSLLERVALDCLVRIACRRCMAIIAVSEFSKREIIDFGFASAEKVCSVLEGVDPKFAKPVVEKRAIDLFHREVPADKPYILTVAHSYPHKNIDLLIEAFDSIQESIPHNLVIVGRARRGEAAVEDAMGRIGTAHRIVRFKDGVSQELLRLLYQKADLFVLPSGYEGFGLPVLESMMAGTPVVCSHRASLPEIGGDHAFYCNELSVAAFGREIKKTLLLERSILNEKIKQARSWAESFSWGAAANKTLEVCAGLTTQRM